jgi:SNF2 family DNA or RNA helicase
MHLEDMLAKPKAAMPISVPGAPPPEGGVGTDDTDLGVGFLSSCARPLEHLAVDEGVLSRASIDYGLMEHQPAGVRHLLARSAALLADDMGLGKTRQAVVASRIAAGERRILVSCPASLRINWEREIHAVFPDDLVGMVGEDRMATLHGCRWVIANYERLGGLVKEPGLAFEVMTIDEAHFLKEHQAGRTRNAFILAERIPRRFLLTGTPILNREVEIHTLLRLSGHPLGLLDLAEFRKDYTGGEQQREALADAVSDWMLRRSKKVLKGLGLKTHQVRYISPADGLAGYQRLLADMSLTVMPKIIKLRQLLETLKTEFLIETVQSLGQDDKVIVFCEYTDTVDFLKEAFQNVGIGAVSLVGSDNGSSRQRAVDAFQADPAIRVFIGTTSAAGVGITLTAANYVMFASPPWTPAMKRQAEDRAYRIGQKRDVIVIVPVVPGTIDEQILALLDSKSEIEASVVEGAVRAQLLRCPISAGAPSSSTTVSQLLDHSIH